MRITNTLLILLLSGMAFSQTQSQEKKTEVITPGQRVQINQEKNSSIVRKAPVRTQEVEAIEKTAVRKQAVNENATKSGGK